MEQECRVQHKVIHKVRKQVELRRVCLDYFFIYFFSYRDVFLDCHNQIIVT